MKEQITGIAHVGIRVADLDTSRAFYEKLGFEFLAGPVGPEPVAFMLHPSGVDLNLILNAKSANAQNQLMDIAEKYSGYTHIALAVRNIDALLPLLEAGDIRITEGPVEFPGARAAFIRDPDGNVIELNQAVS